MELLTIHPRDIRVGDRVKPDEIMAQIGDVTSVRIAGAFVRVTYERGTGYMAPTAFKIGRDWVEVFR